MDRNNGKLAIVGASARAAAFSALRAGFQVVAADLFADADLSCVADATQVTEYPQELGDWLHRVECDGWMYTGALENYPDLVESMARTRPLLGNGAAALRAVRDPLALAAAAAAFGLSFPETRRDAVALPLDGSWLCKTYRGSNGSGVWRLDGHAALERAARQGAYFQRRLSGVSMAAVFVLSEFECSLLGATRQLVGGAEREWHYLGSIGPLPMNAAMDAQLNAIGRMLHHSFGLRGIVGVDLVVENDQFWIIEVNPRFSASVEVLERAIGVSAVGQHAAACDPRRWAGTPSHGPTARESSGPPIHAKQIMYARRQCRISAQFFAWAIGRSGWERGAWLADIPRAGEVIPAGRPVLTVLADGDTLAECEAALQARLDEVGRRLLEG